MGSLYGRPAIRSSRSGDESARVVHPSCECAHHGFEIAERLLRFRPRIAGLEPVRQVRAVLARVAARETTHRVALAEARFPVDLVLGRGIRVDERVGA